MPRCCSGSTCACLIQGGAHLSVAGSGTAQDPFVITGDVDLEVVDNSVFNMTLTGAGTVASPWVISTAFAATASINDLPDVDTAGVTNGQVLSWNAGSSRWVPTAPTTAPVGAVSTDSSLDGDGSVGAPLEVEHSPSGLTETKPDGISLTDVAKNQLVRKFPTSNARDLASPSPSLNSLSMLDTAPGRVDYWTGTQWAPVQQFPLDIGPGEVMQLSGSYAGGVITMMVRQVNDTTDSEGMFEVLSSADLSGYAGVLSVSFQPTGSIGFQCLIEQGSGNLLGHAYRLDDGQSYVGQAVTGVVTAWVYN